MAVLGIQFCVGVANFIVALDFERGTRSSLCLQKLFGMQCIGMSSLERFTQQTPNHMPRLDCPSVSAETLNRQSSAEPKLAIYFEVSRLAPLGDFRRNSPGSDKVSRWARLKVLTEFRFRFSGVVY